jgi:hypothetical protein
LATERGRSTWCLPLVLWSLLAACSWTPGPAAPAIGPSSVRTASTVRRDGESAAGGSTAPVRFEGGASELPVAGEGDCSAICAKLLRCKHGPWDNEQDCRDACEAAAEDDTASRTYLCAAKGTSCAKIKLCGK